MGLSVSLDSDGRNVHNRLRIVKSQRRLVQKRDNDEANKDSKFG